MHTPRRRLILALLLIVSGLIVLNASAQERGTPGVPTSAPTTTAAPTLTPVPAVAVQPGEIVGTISDDAPTIRYQFDGRADQGVSILMETTSGDLDPLLNLYDDVGTLIASNDDQAPGDVTAALILTLPVTGTYVIEATRYTGGNALTSGDFRLTLALSGVQTPEETPVDPQGQPPVFGVPFEVIEIGAIANGRVAATDALMYYAFAGNAGDLVRLIVSRTSGDLTPHIRVLNADQDEIGREVQTRDAESIAYAILPDAGYVLVEVGARAGAGAFDLYINRLANTILNVGDPLLGSFTPETPTISYIVNARIGEALTATLFTTDPESGAQPQLELLDLNLRQIARATGERFVTLRAAIPRSAPYILRVINAAGTTTSGYSLRLSSVPASAADLDPLIVTYNDEYTGAVSTDEPFDVYQFSGKTDEQVTIQMNADSGLDPYLILMDNDLNELIANDDSAGGRNARIVQFRLPKDGDYVILASRSGLSAGGSEGVYRLSLTVGAVQLTDGALSATVEWSGRADLNLFVRDPDSRSVSWSSPNAPSGGTLQIDSNTGCVTASDDPVEHVYFQGDQARTGDYTLWVWHQQDCQRPGNVTAALTAALVPPTFTLTVRLDGDILLTVENVSLTEGQRFEAVVRVSSDGQGFIVNRGEVTQPSDQQTASEGGDRLIRYGEAVTDSLDDTVYARFYQFYGEAGDQVRIQLQRVDGDLDPLLVLRGAGDAILPDSQNDDAAFGTRDSELVYTLPERGQYIVAATRFGIRDGSTNGRFRLIVERVN